MPEVTAATIALITEVAQAFRLAGVQYLLYPADGSIVRQSMDDLFQSLMRLLNTQDEYLLLYEGSTLIINGLPLHQREHQHVIDYFSAKMTENQLRAIRLTRGVSRQELSSFIQLFASTDADDHYVSLTERAAQSSTAFTHIAFYSASSSTHQIVAAGMPPSTLAPRRETPEAPEPISLEDMAQGNAPPTDLATQLIDYIEHAPPKEQAALLKQLVSWVRGLLPSDTDTAVEKVDRFLVTRLLSMDDQQEVYQAVDVIGERLNDLADLGDPERMSKLLRALHDRAERSHTPDMTLHVRAILDHVGDNAHVRQMIIEKSQHRDTLESARQLVALIGERSLQPFLQTLKTAEQMEERAKITQLLQRVGDLHLPLLLRELQSTTNPWYVKRNLLRVLGDAGNTQATTAVNAHLSHQDPRVRAEALAADVRLHGAEAAVHVVQGLTDRDPQVRARAAALIGQCPHPTVLAQAVLLLRTPRFSRPETENVQLPACLGLGHFDDDQARATLLAILLPSFASPFAGKSAQLRSAAATALAGHRDHPLVNKALIRAARDRSPLVRQAAQRALQKHG